MEIEFDELDKLVKTLSDAQKALPAIRREVLEECAEKLQELVRKNIDNSGITDSRGRVKQWQVKYFGTRGGYVAVRAEDSEAGPTSPGAITNYLESGHKNRRPTGRSKRYQPKINTDRTPGHFFYQHSKNEVGKIVQEAAERLAETVAERLEGAG